MNFGKHIEQGLIDFGDRIYQIHCENKELNEKRVLLGWIDDAQKLKTLKSDLYRKVRAEGEVGDLVAAIEILETSIQLEFQRQNTPEAVISRFIASLFVVGIAAVTLSFPINYACGHSQSHFCRNSKVLTSWVISEFQEPSQPTKVLPLNLLNKEGRTHGT